MKIKISEKQLNFLLKEQNGDEIKSLEPVYDKFMRNEYNVKDKDFCDMSQPNGYNLKLEDMKIINAMLPSIYYPKWKNNIFERKSKALVERIYPNLNIKIIFMLKFLYSITNYSFSNITFQIFHIF